MAHSVLPADGSLYTLTQGFFLSCSIVLQQDHP